MTFRFAPKIPFASYFAVPRGIIRKNAGSPMTGFDLTGPPSMRLYLHLLKARPNPQLHIDFKTTALRELTGLPKSTFERARDELEEWGFITAKRVDGRGEVYRYKFPETVTAFAPVDAPLEVPTATWEPIPDEPLTTGSWR